MSDESFNMSMRKFLKRVGVTSQQAIEEATRAAREGGDGNSIDAKVVLTIDGKTVNEVDGTISLRDDQ